jgi:serine phosphatase RsbU (regulator of sigma subunit)
MNTARGIQESLLPAARVSLPRLQIAACYLPMRGIAGDLYGFHIVDDHRVGVLVADVTGHGVPAALIASTVKVAFTAERASAAAPAALAPSTTISRSSSSTSEETECQAIPDGCRAF